jgi:hypothetical protein
MFNEYLNRRFGSTNTLRRKLISSEIPDAGEMTGGSMARLLVYTAKNSRLRVPYKLSNEQLERDVQRLHNIVKEVAAQTE